MIHSKLGRKDILKNTLKKLMPGTLASQNKQIEVSRKNYRELQTLSREVNLLNESIKELVAIKRQEETIPLTVRENIDTLRKLAMKPLYNEIRQNLSPRIMSMEETMTHILEHGASLSRFGDGEFKAMLRINGNLKFQKTSPALRMDLQNIIEQSGSERINLLVGIPEILPGPHWTNVWADYYHEIEPMIQNVQILGNSHVSRPVYFTQWQNSAVESWKAVFDSRKICVITGKKSRFELIPELFSGASEIKFVRGPGRHAYDELDQLESRVLDLRPDLVLVSLGPAGTVLSARLAKTGLQALDVGHISASYKTAFSGFPMPEFTPFE